MAEDYKLVPGPMPSKKRKTVYARILEDFESGKADSARVDMPRKAGTMYYGLINARRGDERFARITVHRRGEEIWLKKA